MSASNEWTIWYLTFRGWERGSEKTDFGDANERPAPGDEVLTFKYSEFMGSMCARDRKHARVPDAGSKKKRSPREISDALAHITM